MRANGERLVASKPCGSLGAQGKPVVRVRVWCLASGVPPSVWATLPSWIIATEDVAVSFARTGSTPSWILCLHQIPSLAAGDMGEGVTAYREITSAWQIARELTDAGFLGEPETNILQGSCLDERALKDAGFQAFASFRTNREKIRWVPVVFVCCRKYVRARPS